jgi:hypothetical protein
MTIAINHPLPEIRLLIMRASSERMPCQSRKLFVPPTLFDRT